MNLVSWGPQTNPSSQPVVALQNRGLLEIQEVAEAFHLECSRRILARTVEAQVVLDNHYSTVGRRAPSFHTAAALVQEGLAHCIPHSSCARWCCHSREAVETIRLCFVAMLDRAWNLATGTAAIQLTDLKDIVKKRSEFSFFYLNSEVESVDCGCARLTSFIFYRSGVFHRFIHVVRFQVWYLPSIRLSYPYGSRRSSRSCRSPWGSCACSSR